MSVQCAFEVYKNTQNEITKKIDSKQFNLNGKPPLFNIPKYITHILFVYFLL